MKGFGGPLPASFDGVEGFTLWQQWFVESLARDRLAHAYLFLGPLGENGSHFLQNLAKLLVCRNPQTGPCRKCSACQWCDAGTHPDVTIFSPQAGESVGVEEVRSQVVEKLQQKSQEGIRKVVLIDQGHKMTWNAQDALLKTLEEPPPGSVLLIAAEDSNSILETVQSRCRIFQYHGSLLERQKGLSDWEEILREIFCGKEVNPWELARTICETKKGLQEKRERAQSFLQAFVLAVRLALRLREGLLEKELVSREKNLLRDLAHWTQSRDSKAFEILLESAALSQADIAQSVNPEWSLENLFLKIKKTLSFCPEPLDNLESVKLSPT